MSEITVPTTGDGWDLMEVLAERTQPTTSVTVYLDEAASFTKNELVQAYSRIPKDDTAARNKAKKAIQDVEKILEKKKYIVNLVGVPTRMREDISSKALSQFPIKRTTLIDDDNAQNRQRQENILMWSAMITGIENPDGKLRTQFSAEQMAELNKSLPVAAINAVDKAIRDLIIAAEKFTVESQDIDFS